jgi:4-hydroxybenzoate polyprenyltransferase
MKAEPMMSRQQAREPMRGVAVLRALRPHQWAKNILVFIPLVTGHELANPRKLLAAILAFVVFSLIASGVYVVNDLSDLAADRKHPEKCRRPFASGKIPFRWGPPMAAGLTAIGFLIATTQFPLQFVACMASYVVLNLLYSIWLKKKLMIDVVVLSMMYTTRVVAGGAATEIAPSEWLLAFSMFSFTSLAFAKRYAELGRLKGERLRDAAEGRAYLTSDMRLIESMGPALGCLSVLVLALYLNSEQVRLLYSRVHVLWLICPLMLYWFGRLWLVAGRGELREDPLVFAVTDWRSWVTAAIGGALLLLGS